MLLWLAGLGAAAQYAKVSAIYDLLQDTYGSVGAALGFAVSLVGVVGVLLGVVSGIIVARVRYRTAILWALWIGAGASAFQATLPEFWLFLLSRALEGVSHLAIVVAAPTLMTALCAPRHTGPVMTLWSTFFGVAFAIVVFAGRPLVEGNGVPSIFLAHAAYLALIAIAVSVLPPAARDDARMEPLSTSEFIRQHIAIYTSPWVGAPAIGWLFFAFGSIGILTLLRPFVAPGWQELVMVAIPLVSIVSALTLGMWLVHRQGAVWTAQVGFLMCGALVLGLLLVPGSPVICLLLATAMGCVQAASFAAVPELNSETEARALGHGAMAQTGNLGNLVSPPLLALAIEMMGGPGLIVGLALAFLLGAFSQVALERRRNGLTALYKSADER